MNGLRWRLKTGFLSGVVDPITEIHNSDPIVRTANMNGAMPELQVRRSDGILGPLLAAWWVYTLSSNCSDTEGREILPIMFFFYEATFAILIRLIAYVSEYRPPLSLWGRIVLGRWMHSRLRLCLAGAVLCVVDGLAWSGCGIFYREELLCHLLSPHDGRGPDRRIEHGPSLGRWGLVGHHRIVPRSGNDPQRMRL